MDPAVTDTTGTGRDPFAPKTVPPAEHQADGKARISAFCDAHGLRDYAETALRLTREAFPDAKGVTLRIEGDLEPDTRCLVIDVATGLGVDESLRRREQFVKRWIAAAPPRVAERICLTLDLS